MKYILLALFVLCSVVLVGCGSSLPKPTIANPEVNTQNTDDEGNENEKDEQNNDDNDDQEKDGDDNDD